MVTSIDWFLDYWSCYTLGTRVYTRLGEPLETIQAEPADSEITWIVYPFLFSSNMDQIRIDWEYDEYR
jgi:hypothetical protein